MERKFEAASGGSPLSRLNEVARGGQPSTLAELERRFAEFRALNAPGTRVPEELRAAVLGALNAGLRVCALRGSCGLSYGQVARWKGGRPRVKSNRWGESAKVRAFSVVEDPLTSRSTPEVPREEALELRVGAWAVSVRLAGPTPARRG